MAERHPGWVNDIDAPEARLATGMLVAAQGVGDTLDPLRVRTGIRDGQGFPGLVALGTNKVTVNPFQAVLADPAKPSDGPYLVTIDAAKELSLGAANASLYRMDLVVAEVVDGDPGFQVTVYAGENSASATPPRPAVTNPLSLVLAEITVPPPTVGTASLKDTRRFTAALNGIIPVRNEADRPPNPYGSMVIMRLDTRVMEVYKGGVWIPYRPPRGSVDGWHPPVKWQNGWSNYGGGYAEVGYTITEDGWVRLRGLMRGRVVDATQSKPAFQLSSSPVNYCPKAHHLFVVATNLSGVNPQIGRVDITADGNVYVLSGNNGWVSLDGISFATY
ncbi:hypothetical protein [Actinophytocola sp.]|uniref:hypothetical protein n=1 Tax=Actinophytocola sp. TaxID=1872138 RepID=UPI003899D0C2